jgi:hypothetical protein
LVDELVDNAIKWAFDSSSNGPERHVSLGLLEDSGGSFVTLYMRDSGRQFPIGWRYSTGGLARIAAICRKIAASQWERGELDQPPYTKQIQVKLYRVDASGCRSAPQLPLEKTDPVPRMLRTPVADK